jgi:hypothetical protein
MFETVAKFEAKVADKVFHFLCDPSSPIENVKEALFQITKIVATIEDQVKAAQAAQQAAQPPHASTSEVSPEHVPLTNEVQNEQQPA